MSIEKKRSIDKNKIMYVLIGFIIIYLSSLIDITIPGTDIPITGQTLAVLSISYLWKDNLGLYTVLLYIILGSLGLPVFADGASGLEVIRGNSVGYIYGFLFAAWLVTQIRDENNKHKNITIFLAMLLGTITIVGIGFMHLSQSIGYDDAYLYGVKPFLIGGIIKIILGTVIVKLVQRYFMKDPANSQETKII